MRSAPAPSAELNVSSVLAAAVAPVRQRLAVRRPARIPLGHARAAGDVDHRAALGGNRDDVAAGLEGDALAAWRDRRGVGQLLRLRGARPQRGGVGDDADLDFGHLLGGEIQRVETAAGEKHDRVRTDRREGDVEVDELGDLPHRAGAEILGPDVVPLARAAVRDEVDGVAAPHRLRVVRRIAGDVARRERLQIEEPQVRAPTRRDSASSCGNPATSACTRSARRPARTCRTRRTAPAASPARRRSSATR